MSPTRETFGNIPPSSQLAFYIFAVASAALFGFGIFRRYRLWRTGIAENSFRVPSLRELWNRFRRTTKEAGLQHRVKGHGIGTFAHMTLYIGFMALFAGTVLLEADHLLSAFSPRLKFHQGMYYIAYEAMLDVLGLLFLCGLLLFTFLHAFRRRTLRNRPSDDWVLLGLAAIGITGYLLEALRIRWQQPVGIAQWCSPVGALLSLALSSLGEAGARKWHLGIWWLHSLLVFGFIAVIPFTRLLHFIVGPLNLFLAPAQPGALAPINVEEVEATGRIGPTDVRHFTWQQLLSLDACVQCGRCDEVCPALGTGKPLSPQAVIQDIKARMERAGEGNAMPSGMATGALSPEGLWSCTTCSACVETCPFRIDHLSFIIPLRRQLIADGLLRGSAATALRRVQSQSNPWGLPATEREKWRTTAS